MRIDQEGWLVADDGDLEKALSTRIEAAVHDIKRARAKGSPGLVGDALPFAA